MQSALRSSRSRRIPGVTDLEGLCEGLAQLSDLAAECADESEMDALCALEARSLRALAATRCASAPALLRKVELLVTRLTGEQAETELPAPEAALLRSIQRDLRRLARRG